MSIKGSCHTNLDNYERQKWPEIFAEIPRQGDRVRSKSGIGLKVCGITHRVLKDEPYIIVELNK